MERTPDARGNRVRDACPGIGELQRIRRAEHEQRERVVVGPGVIADGLHALENHARRAPVEREAPESLCRIALDTHDGDRASLVHRRRRVLTLGSSRRNAGRPLRRNVVAIYVGLCIIPDGREEHARLVPAEAWLVVVTGPISDVDRYADFRRSRSSRYRRQVYIWRRRGPLRGSGRSGLLRIGGLAITRDGEAAGGRECGPRAQARELLPKSEHGGDWG